MKHHQRPPGVLKSTILNPGLIAGSLIAFICGVYYYLVFRNFPGSTTPSLIPYGVQALMQWLPAHHAQWMEEFASGNELHDWSSGTFPSLVHMLSLSLMSFGVLGYVNGARLTIALLAMTIVAEFGVGTTDPFDIFAALLGTTTAIIIASRVLSTSSSKRVNTDNHRQPHTFYTALSSLGILLCSTYFITGTSCVEVNCGDSSNARPVYMDYNTLRNSVAVEDAKEIGEVKRVYLYQEYIFLNRKNEGIHVIDNTDPANPNNLRFINIPGNTELAIRGNYLYADSYIDLVTLDLNNLQDIQEVARQEEVFPWDERQNIPDNIYFDYFDIDRNRGVVVSYEIQ